MKEIVPMYIGIFNLDYKMDFLHFISNEKNHISNECTYSRSVTVLRIFLFLRKREKTKENGVKNTYYGLQEKQGPSRFSRPVAIMGLNGGIKVQCSSQSSYHCFLCYHLCFFHFHWWWNWATWVLLSKLCVSISKS